MKIDMRVGCEKYETFLIEKKMNVVQMDPIHYFMKRKMG